MCADPSNEVLIFSGSEMAKLEETFGALPLWLAAENGVYVRPPIRPELPQVRLGSRGRVSGSLSTPGQVLCLLDNVSAAQQAAPSR